jgi:hypothetical protein
MVAVAVAYFKVLSQYSGEPDLTHDVRAEIDVRNANRYFFEGLL